MLSIQGLSAGYDGSEILHTINLEVGDREIVALIGPNGSGKSTLLRSVFNLADVYRGSIKFGNKELAGLPINRLVKHGIAFVPQDEVMFPAMTVAENLEVAGYSVRDALPAKEIYKQFPILAEKKRVDARNLSGGQKRILAIARSLIQKPLLLLLDEPSAGLDPKMAREVFQMIEDIKDRGSSVLMAEQNAKQAVAIADNTYILEAGEVKLRGNDRILDSSELRKVFLGSS